MVSGIVGEISCRLVFHLANNTSFSFNTNDDINRNNYLTSIKLDEKLSENNYIPVGVNTATVLDIEGISNNHALIPENTDSMYYGYMNNTCYIDLYVTESGNEYNFGRYYVDSWKSDITDTTPNRFTISATNLMGYIGKLDVPDINMADCYKFKNYIESVVVALNEQFDSSKHIYSVVDGISFDQFPTMYFSMLNNNNISDCLNDISLATVTNIYIDRANTIRTDYLLDDRPQEAEYTIDILVSSQAGSTDLVNYDNVKLNYLLGSIKDTEVIASLYDHVLSIEEPTIEEISLGDGLYKVNRIDVTSSDGSYVGIVSTKYSKNKMSITFDIENTTNINLVIYGQRLDNTLMIINSGSSNNIEITNKIITSDLAYKYTENINRLIQIKNNSMEVEAYITPEIKLSDTVHINAIGAMSMSGYYKVVGLAWDFGQYGKCKMNLVKTFENDAPTTEVISNTLQTQLEYLHEAATTYNTVNPSSITGISSETSNLYMQNNEVYDTTYQLHNVALGG